MLEEVFHLIRQMKIFEMNNSSEKIFNDTTLYSQLKNVVLLNFPTDISVDQHQNRTNELLADSYGTYTV